MAKPLDLEEQQQLDALKAFWAQWGNFITWLLIAVFGSIAAYNGYQFWQKRVALQAASMYDEVQRAVDQSDLAKLERATDDMKKEYARATATSHAALLAAKTFAEKGSVDKAKLQLAWVTDNSKDDGLAAVARLRLAGLLIDAKAYDDAGKLLAANFPEQFKGLVADRKGDMALMQGQRDEAKKEFLAAFAALGEDVDYRRLVEVKLNSLGVEPPKPAASAASAPAAPVAVATPAPAAAPASATPAPAAPATQAAATSAPAPAASR
jgi:predicted negative regulator of RcsB-dependent stress response